MFRGITAIVCGVAVLAGGAVQGKPKEAQLVTIAGYPLGEPFSMAACPKDRFGGTDFSHIAKACWTSTEPRSKGPDETRQVWWPAGKIPLGYAMWVDVRNGRLEAVEFATTGADDQATVMAQLINKFGAATSLTRERVQNALGAQFDRLLAIWESPQVYVEFHGMEDQIDQGNVRIETPDEHQRRLQRRLQSQPSKL